MENFRILPYCPVNIPSYLNYIGIQGNVKMNKNAFARLGGHLVDITTVKVQLFGNLVVGQVQPHEIEA
jgi:hypothetical protein